MPPGNNPDFIYNPIWIERYIKSLPLWRKILARYFEKYKVTKEEYDKNIYEIIK
jgi:hypothetical protein